MTAPFVPVDLDKLLDEFEETEEVLRPNHENSCSEENGIVGDASSLNGCSSLKGAKQIYHPAFPCIQEEGCSDQGSDGQSEDKDDSGSDCSSVGRIIAAAEAITSSNDDHDLIPELREQVGCNDPKLSVSNCNNCSSNHSEISSTQKDADNSTSGDSGIDKEDEHSYFQCDQIVVNISESQNLVTASPDVVSHCVTPVERVYNTDGNGLRDDVSSEQSSEMLHPQNTEDEKEGTSKREDWSIDDGNSELSEVDKKIESDSRDDEFGGNLVDPSAVADSIGATAEKQTGDTHTRNNSLSLNLSGSQSIRSNRNISDLDVCQASDDQMTDSVNNASLVELQHLSSMTVRQDESEALHAVSQPNLKSDVAEVSQANVDSDSNSHHVSFVELSGITGVSHQTSFEPINQEVRVSDQGANEPWETSVLGAQMSGSCMGMTPQGSTGARRISSGESCLGRVPPIWVPDSVATHCMNCGLKFSVIKRRHHCRACGKALCSSCCNMKFILPYMDNREGRVCQICCNALLRAQAERLLQQRERSNHDSQNSMHNSAKDEAAEELTASLDSEPERVQDAEYSIQGTEGIQENVADFSEVIVARRRTVPAVPPLQLPETNAVSQLSTDIGTPLATPTSPALSDDSDCLFRLDVDNVRSMLPEDITALPPVVSVVNEEITIQERPDPAEIMYQLKGCHATVVFMLNKNLVVKVKIVKLKCCVKRKCWCFVTEGMGAANQEEMVVLLECLDKETLVPKDVLSHFNTAFAYAKQGHTVSELGYTIFGQPFLGSSDNAGFLYVKPTFQCLKNLPLPCTPYVVGLLIKRMETPWAQLFPLRLQLRLGAEYRYYPCPLFSTRNRPAVYQEIGHTIMNLLADFKNFQYTLARVTGLVIHMEENRTVVRLPQDRYDEIIKILNATDEHVMALGANFSHQADSHLVCIQNEQGYKTQAINIQNQARKVTGASFIVFSGALKASSPFNAKVNIVEDGIMLQMIPQLIGELRHSLKEMQDYTITTGEREDELVVVEWVSRQDALQPASICSPIDGLQLDSFPCVKVYSGCDFTRKSIYRIQWTEAYFLGDRRNSSAAWQQCASRDLNQLTTELAKAFCQTLRPHLRKLSHDKFTLIGLRVNLDSDDVGYSTGSNSQSLATDILAELDTVLVPVIHSAVSRHRGPPLNVELFFKILRLL